MNNEELQEINGGGLFSKILGFIVGTAEYAYELSCLQGGTAGGRAGAWGARDVL